MTFKDWDEKIRANTGKFEWPVRPDAWIRNAAKEIADNYGEGSAWIVADESVVSELAEIIARHAPKWPSTT